ncbi:E3 ubiquitin-protein ligase rnf13, variant 2 [Clonorchis sinensis]|uniref:E3 ubiquitin-protein ligase rnf13, variant 2 n=1 Tax=Clonorchis sinensis TaxID=79923 RepID=A0A8T1MXE6_CLOSI|nr:E3 ubiquitin-protein ligase rnf13, variant 2 [Clonorchis sinensis]
MKIRRYVCHRVRSCLPGEFVEPCSAYFSTSELNEEHVSMMRSLVYYTFLRAIRNYWTMRPRSRNSSASRSTLSSDGSFRRTTNQRENQSDSEGEYLAADQTRRESDSTDVKGPRLSSYTVASLVSSNQSGKLPCCSICLADFEENDEIITLPCFHVYHQACVQPWLSSVSESGSIHLEGLNPRSTQPQDETSDRCFLSSFLRMADALYAD